MRILVIEDEIKIAQAIKRALELQKYSVDMVHDGLEGYDLAVSEEYDLILLDLMLPGMDGITLCKKIREDGIVTPVMMLTAKGQISDKVTGLDVGADDYLIKPFSFEELFARVRALTRRSTPNRKTTLKIGDLTLDTVSFKVKFKNESIKLSSREFAILEYLMQNKNIVISRDKLINHVWNYDTDVMPNVVEVHIKHLRDKLKQKNHPDLIQTVRGRGYLIEDEK